MKLRYLFFILLSAISVFGQKKLVFNLELKEVYDASLDKTIMDGSNVFLNNEFLPEFAYSFNIGNGESLKKYKYRNLIVSKLTLSELKNVDASLLKIGFSPSARIVKRNNENILTLYSNVVYKDNNGSLFKVVSFDFEYSLDTVSSTRISQTNILKTQINSVLSTGTWYKIAIDKTGVFKMDSSFLNSIGINTSSLDPKKIRVYGNGGALLPELLSETRKEDLVENAIFVSGENDNVFNENDYVLFFGQGPTSWNLDSRDDISHVQNIYDDFAYYFINVDSGINGKRIQNKASVSQTTTKIINTFTDYLVHEKELINYTRVGREWFGEDFDEEDFQTFDFTFPDIDITVPAIARVDFSANSTTSSFYSVLYNDREIVSNSIGGVRTISGLVNAFEQEQDDVEFTAINSNLDLDVSWDNRGNVSAEGHLNYLEVIADRFLTYRGDSFLFTNFNSILNSQVLEYVISEISEIDMVWNITDHTNVENLLDTDVSSNLFKFKELTDGDLDRYCVVNSSNAYSPIRLAGSSNISNQNLHGLSNIQYLIITTNELKSQAERLANYHRQNTKISDSNTTLLNVEVVDVEEIYNEFGSGSADITAIRDFVKYIYDQDTLTEAKLKYLCLFGDTSFDYKGIIYPGTNIVPTYESPLSENLHQSYASDDYYGYLDASDDVRDDGDIDASLGQLDISTGRIPVKTAVEARQFVNKALNYYSTNSFGFWKNKISLLGDDGQGGDDQDLIEHLESSAKIIEGNNPNLNLQKLYTDAFEEVITSGGGSYPDVKKRFDDTFNTGALVINYFGHGSVSGLGEENYLDISDIISYRNLDNLPLFVTVTCDFSRLDDPTFVSGGEELMIGANGGAVSMITTSREISVNAGRDINNELANFLYNFDGKSRSIAEALKDVKNQLRSSSERFVFFFGDPAMKLSFPEENIVIDKITKEVKDSNTGNVSFIEVTELNGLSKLRVTGEVQENGFLNTNFSGKMSVLLYEKEIDRETLLNEAGGVTVSNQGDVVKFKSLESTVFRGEASVVNGIFTFDFILPKDVSVIPDNAKFSLYAFSDNEDNTGSDFRFSVGGIDADAEEDTTPPVIQLFFEDESFVDGGSTSITPVLVAKIFDESGINTSLNAIGHDISLVIDGDLSNPISLNEFYTTESDDFTNGIVSFELPELELGSHTVTFTAWDTHNNSSTQTLSLFVEEDSGFKISDVLNYPNPFINHTEFWFNHNRRRDSFDIKIQVYTVSGKLIKTIRSFVTDNSGTIRLGNAPTWNGKDDFGNRLGKGVYLYKLVVKDLITGEVDEKVEKLVIL